MQPLLLVVAVVTLVGLRNPYVLNQDALSSEDSNDALSTGDTAEGENVAPECNGHCFSSGDPHYQTFDCLRFEYHGKCSYTLMTSCDDSLEYFEVVGDNERMRYHPEYAFTKSITIKTTDQNVRLTSDREVYLNDKLQSTNGPIVFNINGHVTFNQDTTEIVVDSGMGFTLTWGSPYRSEIAITDDNLRGKICGICGNSNSDKSDDMVDSENNAVTDSVAYGDSWNVEEACGPCEECVPSKIGTESGGAGEEAGTGAEPEAQTDSSKGSTEAPVAEESTDINECASNPCQGNGVCIIERIVGYICDCNTGWTGKNCENDIDDCANDPCVNGNCFDDLNEYTCECNPGWTGDNCEIDIHECASSPCQGNGVCMDEIDGYSCECNPGWTGDNCGFDIDDCANDPCVNGNCFDDLNYYTCECNPGWTGDNCDIDINECATNDHGCHVNGSCYNIDGSYYCTCNTGYEGDGLTCEDNNECGTNDHGCHVNGTCYNTDGSYKCTCNTGYSGDGLTCEAYCPENWIFRNNYCYYFNHKARVSFEEAQSQCQDLEADLISIHSQDEQNFTANNAQREAFPASPDKWYHIGYWIGFNDEATEGAYVWTDGTTVDYTSWLEGQPNDYDRDQDCVAVSWEPADGFVWHDIGCSYAYAYICTKS